MIHYFPRTPGNSTLRDSHTICGLTSQATLAEPDDDDTLFHWCESCKTMIVLDQDTFDVVHI